MDDAQSALANVRRRQQTPKVARSCGLTWLHEEFLTEQRFAACLSPVTLRGYKQSFSLLTSIMPALTVEQLTPAAMTAFFRRLDTRQRTAGQRTTVGVKPSTVATYRSKLNGFFTWLKGRGHIPANPFEAMPYPRVAYEDKKYLGRGEVERVFAALIVPAASRRRFLRKRNLTLFALLLYAGLRKGELLGLRACDVDLDRLELTVQAETSKSRSRRVVPINSRLASALEDYLEERQKYRHQSERLLTSLSGRPLTADGLKHLVERVKRLSGVRFHVHQFRHTFAVNLLNQGSDIAKVKQLLGHRDIRMTSAYLRALPTRAMRMDVENVALDTLL
jgi:integrase/recombinase XerD